MTAWKRNVPAFDNATEMYKHKRFFVCPGVGGGDRVQYYDVDDSSSTEQPERAVGCTFVARLKFMSHSFLMLVVLLKIHL